MFKFSHLYHICSAVYMKEVKDLQDLCGAVSVTTMVPHFTPFFSFSLGLLHHHCFCSVPFHIDFSVECLLPALVSVFQMNFYHWSLSSQLFKWVPIVSHRCHAACYYLVALLSSGMRFPLLMCASRPAFNSEPLATISSTCHSLCPPFLIVSPAHSTF